MLLIATAPIDLKLKLTPKSTHFKLLLFGINLLKEKKKKPKAQKTDQKPQKKKKKKIKFKEQKEKLLDILDWAKIVLNRLGKLLGGIRVKRLKFNYTASSEDAAKTALEYGTICALVYPIAGIIEAKTNISQNALVLDINCDYDKKESDYLLDVFLRLRGYHTILAVISILINKYAKK